MSLRALSRRVARIEQRRTPRPSPIVVMYGSFDHFVSIEFQPAWDSGSMAKDDILEIIAALRRWEEDGVWDRAHAS
jgi:hypothetical protein